jgi:hypothetical protein
LAKLHADPMTRWMAAGAPLVNVQKAFWGGRMAHFREMLVNAGNTEVATRAGSDEFMRTYFVRLMKATDGDNELLAAVAKNSLRGHPVTDGVKINSKVTRMLKGVVEADNSRGPAYLTGPVSGTARETFQAKSNAGIQSLFHFLGTMPTNRFSRSVTHQQFYWNRLEELAPMMTAKSRKLLIRNAEKTRLPKARIAKIKADLAASPPGELNLRDADWAAGRYALGEVKRLLYDLHEKGQWADAIRILGPFAEAQKEVALTWARLIKNRPAIPYRADQAVDKLDDDGSGVVYDLTGTPHPSEPGNRGFFFTDQWGEERFAYPGSQLLTALAGDPGGFSTPVQGLNMFGTMAIGAGPVVSMPFAKMAPRGEDWEWLRGQILPYGDPDTGSGMLEAFFPAYGRKILLAFGVHPSAAQQRAFANQAHTIATYLLTTGDYDVSTDEGKDRLLQDAQHKARVLFLVRGLAQSTLPSAPSPQALALDKDGHLTFQYLMAQDYQKMRKDPDIRPSRCGCGVHREVGRRRFGCGHRQHSLRWCVTHFDGGVQAAAGPPRGGAPLPAHLRAFRPRPQRLLQPQLLHARVGRTNQRGHPAGQPACRRTPHRQPQGREGDPQHGPRKTASQTYPQPDRPDGAVEGGAREGVPRLFVGLRRLTKSRTNP